MKWVVRIILLISIASAAYVYRTPLRVFALQSYTLLRPCAMPITYGLGSIDPRFKISTSSVLAAIESATNVWNAAAGKPLFVYKPNDPILTVNFIYDTRQETSQTLKRLGLSVNDDLRSYNELKEKYDSLSATYIATKASFNTAYASYQQQSMLYQQQVNDWNAKGGAPSDVYKELNAQKASLEARREHIQALQTQLNTAADSINALVNVLNHMVSALNIETSKYNSIGAGIGQEFEEAVFESAPGRERIQVYEYDSSARLMRVLTHEFGHALGLNHLEDEGAIMYRLNQGGEAHASAADIAELARVCRL